MPVRSVAVRCYNAVRGFAVMAMLSIFIVGCVDDPQPFSERFTAPKTDTSKPLTSVMTASANDFRMDFQLGSVSGSGDALAYSAVLNYVSLQNNAEQLGFKVLKYNAISKQPSWPNSSNDPAISADAQEISVSATSMGNAEVLWSSGGSLMALEFMGMHGHFMDNAPQSLGVLHAPIVLSQGMTRYLVAQSHSAEGFALELFQAGSNDTWSASSLALSRVDAASPMAMAHDDLAAVIDGEGNIRAVWRETQGGDIRIMTALFDTAAGSWGNAMALIDSAVDSKGLDLSAISSIQLVADAGGALYHVILYIETADNQLIYTLDAMVMNNMLMVMDPMRRDLADVSMDGMTSILHMPVLAGNGSSHALAWVENSMQGMTIKTLRFTGGSWGSPSNAAALDANAMVMDLHMTMNAAGHIAIVWSDMGQFMLTQFDGTSWSAKTPVAAVGAQEALAVKVVMSEDDIPWVAYALGRSMGQMTMADVYVKPMGLTVEPGSGFGKVLANTDYVSGYWGDRQQLDMDMGNGTTAVSDLKLQTLEPETQFISWSRANASGEPLQLIRLLGDGTKLGPHGVDPGNTIAASASMIQFTALGDNSGIALWDDAGILKASEYLQADANSAPALSGVSEFGEAHAARIVAHGAEVFLVAQSHTVNGFSIDAYMHGETGWGSAVSLAREDATSMPSMAHTDLYTMVDGMGELRAVWKETQGTVTRLMTATFNDVDMTWSAAETLLDSSMDTMGVDVAMIKSISMAIEHGSSNYHLVLFVVTADNQMIYTMDQMQDANGMLVVGNPVRRDLVDPMMDGMVSIVGDMHSSVYHSKHVVAWVQSHMHSMNNMPMEMISIQSMSYDLVNGWSALKEVAMPAMDATISQLGVSINHPGNSVAYWLESDSNGTRILSATQMAGADWSMKELVFAPSADVEVVSLAGDILHDNVPLIVWQEKMLMANGMPMFTTFESMRRIDASDTLPKGTPPADSGTGSGNGTTDPGTGTGTGNGNGTTDPGTGTGTGTGNAGSGLLEGKWASSNVIYGDSAKPAVSIATTAMPVVSQLKLQTSQAGDLLASWLLESEPDASGMPMNTQFKLMRGSGTDGTWSDPDNGMFQPNMYNAMASDTQFTINSVSGDGIAAWNYNGMSYTSEFMQGMGHFMNSASLPEGHATKIVNDAGGQVYMLSQTHVTDGFALTLYKRTAADTWSTPDPNMDVLQRVDSAMPYAMPNHFLVVAVDGQSNLRALWLEEQNNALSLQTASYDTQANNWSAVSTIDTGSLMLNSVVSAKLGGMEQGNANLQLLLHIEDMSGQMSSHSLYALAYSETDTAWSAPQRLDMDMANMNMNIMMVSAPYMAANSAGHMAVAWVQHDMSNASYTLTSLRYTPAMGWGMMMDQVAQSANALSAPTLAMNAQGDISAAWLMASGNDGYIASSHFNMAAHMADTAVTWSEPELTQMTMAADGSVQALALALDKNNVPVLIWASAKQVGSNTEISFKRIARASAISDAMPATGTTDPGTGTGTTDPGTGTGTGTTNPGSGGDSSSTPGGGNDIPQSAMWSTPMLVNEMTHSSSNYRIYGPQLQLDDLGNASIRLSMSNRNYGSDSSLSQVMNTVMQSAQADLGMPRDNFMNILMDSTVLDDLSSSALIESIQAVPSTGTLYALIRDGDRLYLGRNILDNGWSKVLIPDVSARISRSNMQLTINKSGMVTLVWYSAQENSFQLQLNAKHFMTSTDWTATESIAVASDAIIKPYNVDDQGIVHVAWVEPNVDPAVGGFDLKMAEYTPMQGWSAVMDGPMGMRSAIATLSVSGAHKVVAVSDAVSDSVDAYILQDDGSWAAHMNINQHQPGDGVSLRHHNKLLITAGGGDHFLVAWRERADINGVIEYRYRSSMLHYMTDASGMAMWHVEAPSLLNGLSTDRESNLAYVLDKNGKAYAIWTAVDMTENSDNVYINTATMNNGWGAAPERLASYDLSMGNSAGSASIAINANDSVAVAWDQHVASSTTATHRLWYAQNIQTP